MSESMNEERRLEIIAAARRLANRAQTLHERPPVSEPVSSQESESEESEAEETIESEELREEVTGHVGSFQKNKIKIKKVNIKKREDRDFLMEFLDSRGIEKTTIGGFRVSKKVSKRRSISPAQLRGIEGITDRQIVAVERWLNEHPYSRLEVKPRKRNNSSDTEETNTQTENPETPRPVTDSSVVV